MELSDEDGYYLQKEAENFWNEHKNDSPINMETRWFQKELNSLLINNFKSQNVIWDPKITRGKVDFLVFNLPVEAKCYNDTRNPNTKEKTGLTMLDEEISQTYQYCSHTNIGVQILFDFRDKEMKKDYKLHSITERIKFKKDGHKLICQLVILRRHTPSEIKKIKEN